VSIKESGGDVCHQKHLGCTDADIRVPTESVSSHAASNSDSSGSLIICFKTEENRENLEDV
jgi:hypothetical protein